MAQHVQLLQGRQQLHVVLDGFAKAKAGVQDDLVRVHPGGLGHAHALGQKRADFPADIPVTGIVLHGVRLTLDVHDTHRNIRLRRHFRCSVTLEGTDIIDQPRAELCGFCHYRRVAGVYGNNSIQFPGNGLDHRAHPVQLFLGGNLCRSRPGGFTAYINKCCTVRHHLAGADHGGFQRIEATTVRKRIRGYIQDAHYMAQGEVQFTAGKVHFHSEDSRGNTFGETKTNAAREPGGALYHSDFGCESVLAGRAPYSGLAPVVRAFRLRRLLRLFSLYATGRTTIAPILRRARLFAGHDVVNLEAIDGFVLHQRFRHHVELVPVINQDLLGGLVAGINDVTDFLIDTLCRFRRIHGMRLPGRTTQERLFAVGIVLQRAQLLGQTPAGDHIAGQAGGSLDIVGRTGGHTLKAQSQLLGNTATKQATDRAGQVALGVAVLVLFRQEHGDTQCPATGNDTDLIDRVMLRHESTHNRMARLVVRGVPLLFLTHHHGLALGAIMILSFASSNSSMDTRRWLRRAANRAASFTRLARSAPEKPGVPRAITAGSMPSARGTFFMCTFRICSRPRISGKLTTTWRSKRPGRNSAGSSTSGRLVAAITITPSLPSKPSISTSNWFRVCSRSSCPPPIPAPRWRPTASISSMKMMQGLCFLACSNMSRTREAPTPTNISTKSEPEIEKNGTLASPAMALASRVLPVPGGPTISTPLGMRPPRRWNLLGSRRKSTSSLTSSFASSTPATSAKVVLI